VILKFGLRGRPATAIESLAGRVGSNPTHGVRSYQLTGAMAESGYSARLESVSLFGFWVQIPVAPFRLYNLPKFAVVGESGTPTASKAVLLTGLWVQIPSTARLVD
jgi:hypothetical protein